MKLPKWLPIIVIVCVWSVVCGPFEQCRALGRGLNLGNWLEAPTEGAWGVTIVEADFPRIAAKGFNSLRIPIRWSGTGRVGATSPYTVSETFFQRVDWAIDNANGNGLYAVINCHHYDEMFVDPEAHRERFLAMWEQIAHRYRNRSDSLVFEILNEPNGQLTAIKWNALLADALALIREENPTRSVVIGTAEWGGPASLAKLALPNDPNLILTVHYYNPFSFTHQGASWVDGSQPWLGTTWQGDYFEKLAVQNDLRYVRVYSQEKNIPVYVGEFGAYSEADMASRARWTSYCARLFESYGFAWSYWEYCAGFGAFDRSSGQWRQELAGALISDDTSMLAMGSPGTGTNILRNGDFSSGRDYWTFGAWRGTATGTVAGGIFTAAITDAGSNGWDVQLLQAGVRLKAATRYVLVFEAWSDSTRTIGAGVENAATYSSYGSLGGALLGTEPAEFATSFMVASADTNGRVSFSIGGQNAPVYIDNVRLLEIGTAGTGAGSSAPHKERRFRVVPLRGGAHGSALPSGLGAPLTVRDPLGRLVRAGAAVPDPAGSILLAIPSDRRRAAALPFLPALR